MRESRMASMAKNSASARNPLGQGAKVSRDARIGDQPVPQMLVECSGIMIHDPGGCTRLSRGFITSLHGDHVAMGETPNAQEMTLVVGGHNDGDHACDDDDYWPERVRRIRPIILFLCCFPILLGPVEYRRRV